jgi:hypothetical protein
MRPRHIYFDTTNTNAPYDDLPVGGVGAFYSQPTPRRYYEISEGTRPMGAFGNDHRYDEISQYRAPYKTSIIDMEASWAGVYEDGQHMDGLYGFGTEAAPPGAALQPTGSAVQQRQPCDPGLVMTPDGRCVSMATLDYKYKGHAGTVFALGVVAVGAGIGALAGGPGRRLKGALIGGIGLPVGLVGVALLAIGDVVAGFKKVAS